jgi:endonuclease/exonuclease/phosphatase (EEP) superfamily protein YafD
MELKVATFNVFQSNLPTNATPVLERWGRELLSKADVVLITEARSAEHVNTMAAAAGLAHVWVPKPDPYSDVAIVSRLPFSSQDSYLTDPGSLIAAATIGIDGASHRFLATHWPTGGTVPWVSHPDRIAVARKVIEITTRSAGPIFLGGDFNVCPFPREADECDRSSGRLEEYDLIAQNFYDSYRLSDAQTSGNRIDQIHYRGKYRVSDFQWIGDIVQPSDHPFVLVTFEPTESDYRARAVSASILTPGYWLSGKEKAAQVTIKNSGTDEWTRREQFGLVLWKPRMSSVWSPNFVPLPFEVAPGVTFTFSFPVKAPATPGMYDFQWRMARDDGSLEWFGERTLNLMVRVVDAVATVPDVVGRIRSVAQRSITRANLKARFLGAVGLSHVGAQNPIGGTTVLPGSTVTCELE